MDCLGSKHDKNNSWCRFPRAKCVCASSDRYERLEEEPGPSTSLSETSSGKEEKLMTFYTDDGSSQSTVVEKNLCTNDLCQLLALKNTFPSSIYWSIVEYWQDYGLERLLEDHEYILTAYNDMKNFNKSAQFKYIYRKVLDKYEFFEEPQKFFPSDMLDIDDDAYSTMRSDQYIRLILKQEDRCPVIFSHVWMKDSERKSWSKAFLLLKDKKLFLSHQLDVIGKFIRMSRNKETREKISEKDVAGLTVLAHLNDYFVYSSLNAKNQLKAPTEWGIVLRPASNLADTEERANTLYCLSCTSEQARTCWITAMRLAKYGKQIRENYRAFKNKHADSINPKEYNSYTVPNESVRSRVAMDFTGAVGRIVEDPKEADAIAVAEGYSWKRRWRPCPRGSPTVAARQSLDSGVHVAQPWFHGGMTRDQATQLVTRHGTVDGVFLVRQSRSNNGAFVLTYKCGNKVIHCPIIPILDPTRDAHVFSLDNGVTKFYDLLQLIEFYQLNAGCLPTRLTHYVTENNSPIKSHASSSSSNLSNSF